MRDQRAAVQVIQPRLRRAHNKDALCEEKDVAPEVPVFPVRAAPRLPRVRAVPPYARNDAARRRYDDIAAIQQQHVRVHRAPPFIVSSYFVARRPLNASVVAQRRLDVALDRRQAPYAN